MRGRQVQARAVQEGQRCHQRVIVVADAGHIQNGGIAPVRYAALVADLCIQIGGVVIRILDVLTDRAGKGEAAVGFRIIPKPELAPGIIGADCIRQRHVRQRSVFIAQHHVACDLRHVGAGDHASAGKVGCRQVCGHVALPQIQRGTVRLPESHFQVGDIVGFNREGRSGRVLQADLVRRARRDLKLEPAAVGQPVGEGPVVQQANA